MTVSVEKDWLDSLSHLFKWLYFIKIRYYSYMLGYFIGFISSMVIGGIVGFGIADILFNGNLHVLTISGVIAGFCVGDTIGCIFGVIFAFLMPYFSVFASIFFINELACIYLL